MTFWDEAFAEVADQTAARHDESVARRPIQLMLVDDDDDDEDEGQCDLCDGSGDCQDCGGTGEDHDDDEEECDSCDGSGRCHHCDGTGKP